MFFGQFAYSPQTRDLAGAESLSAQAIGGEFESANIELSIQLTTRIDKSKLWQPDIAARLMSSVESTHVSSFELEARSLNEMKFDYRLVRL